MSRAPAGATISGVEFLVPETATIRGAMASLERSGVQIALVVDAAGRLVGTLTDGDVRRALLAGAGLDSPLAPHVQRHAVTVGPAVGRAEVLDLMRARGILGIPIVDESRRVLGLHTLHEIVGGRERSHWAVIMAGGRGVRLRPLTQTLPKPMVPVAGRPILERLVLHLVGLGIRRVFLAVHYLGHTIEEHFGDGSAFGCRIEYLRETRPLGSGGALSLLPEAPERSLLVLNGDLVTQADAGALLDFHERGGFAATVGIRPYHHQVPYGCVAVEGHRLTSFEEKPVVTRLVNAGLYALRPDLLPRVPSDSEFSLPALIEDCLARGEVVGAFDIQEDWIDVGHSEQLRAAREGAGS